MIPVSQQAGQGGDAHSGASQGQDPGQALATGDGRGLRQMPLLEHRYGREQRGFAPQANGFDPTVGGGVRQAGRQRLFAVQRPAHDAHLARDQVEGRLRRRQEGDVRGVLHDGKSGPIDPNIRVEVQKTAQVVDQPA